MTSTYRHDTTKITKGGKQRRPLYRLVFTPHVSQSDGLRQEYFYTGGRETRESGSTLENVTRYFLLTRFT